MEGPGGGSVTNFQLYSLADPPLLPPLCRHTIKNTIYLGVHWHAAGRGAARGGASFGRADAAQVCNHVGFAAADDGPFECSGTKAARRIVSERWRDDTVHCCYARAHTPARSHNARGRLRAHTRTHISNFCQKRGAAVLITCVDCEIRRQTGSCN